ncbi:type VI secretion system secreted protein VgrG [Herbaspirillum sp. 1173]|uniref:type VI secretion system Vgr family protein n=1 Tax=Herbaspirillum sp. 1173 TaxID=2817734 RepID=UPI00285A47D0|nr:type VI secretion system tip protein TssI/VgrG [Herbaspirillum sp. 1173]MDR6739167.1 type VI secretion system secreted protein VgrG [Herbaspirillum sp. 1173]
MAALNDLGKDKRFEFAVGTDSATFHVVSMTGQEGLSRLFQFDLTLVTDKIDVNLDGMLANDMTLTILSADQKTRTPYHGVLSVFEQLHHAGGHTFYRAVLVPHVWTLSLSRVSDLYLDNKRTPDLIKSVLEKAMFNSNHVQIDATTDFYQPRNYVSQVAESHLDFISRWMERDGLYYYFDHDGKLDKLRIVDKSSAHGNKVETEYHPHDKLDTGVSNKSVQSFTGSHRRLPASVMVQDYNYEKAALPLEFKHDVSATGAGEVMLRGEHIRDEAEGKRYALLRAEEIICTGKLYNGESTVVGLRSGYLMQMSGHYRKDFNASYLVTSIEHRGSQAGALLNGMETPYNRGELAQQRTFYTNSFEAIPSDVQYRAPRLTPWPSVSGTVTAVIDSSGAGDYADLDKKGRYLVQMRFNQTRRDAGKGSVRVRMASPFSTNGKDAQHGMHAPLRKGTEVLLSFDGGDPDRPVIMSTVSNSENVNVVNEDNKARTILSTPGNRIAMNETKGQEAVGIGSKTGSTVVAVGALPAGQQGFWRSTSGSSYGLTVGTDTKVTAGVKNSVTLALENSLSAGVATKFNLGSSVSFGLAFDMSWKAGRSFTIDDGKSVSLKEDGKLVGNTKVTIAGGQKTLVKETLKKWKLGIRGAVLANTAVNVALGMAATAEISMMANTDASGKLPMDDEDNKRIATLYGGLAGLEGTLAQVALQKTGSYLEGLMDSKTNPYTSNIVVDDKGVDIKVDDVNGQTSNASGKFGLGTIAFIASDAISSHATKKITASAGDKTTGIAIQDSRGVTTTADKTTFSVAQDQVKATVENAVLLMKKDATELKSGETTLSLTSSDAKLEKGSSMLKLDGSESFIGQKGGAFVKATATDILVKSGGTQFKIGATGSKIIGLKIELG